MKYGVYTLLVVAAIGTLIIGIDVMSKKSLVSTVSTIGVLIWAVTPYGFLAILVKVSNDRVVLAGVFIVSAFICFWGLALVIDSMYIHKDQWSSFKYIFVPVYQWIGALVLALPVFLLRKGKNV